VGSGGPEDQGGQRGGLGAEEHATYLRHGKASESGRGYSHHLDNHERDAVCGKMLIDACNTRAWMLAAMEEVVPVCDRFLTLGRFSTAQLMIALVVILIRNSLHFTR